LKKKQLKIFYDKVYSGDKNSFFLKYRNGNPLSPAHELAITWLKNDMGEAIIDFGCGEGDFLYCLENINSKTGIDYSEIAINNAKKKYNNINFIIGNHNILNSFKVDVITSFGTLEHTENPLEVFNLFLEGLNPGGKIIISCPNFINVRGVIWMTLVKLFDVPMSLSDKHYLTPHDFKEFENNTNAKLIKMQSVDLDISQGKDFKLDMEKRLINALNDVNYDNSKVLDLIDWVEKNMEYFPVNIFSGVEMLYMFQKSK
jgi:2-polyprenyl-3-methyl-5-hydroxy-6-metoxy-1,4-benzoquinol methylase